MSWAWIWMGALSDGHFPWVPRVTHGLSAKLASAGVRGNLPRAFRRRSHPSPAPSQGMLLCCRALGPFGSSRCLVLLQSELLLVL